MSKKTETIFGIAGGSIGVIIAAVIFYVAIINIWPGGGTMMYGTSEVFGISDPFVVMMGFGTVTLILGLIGIAGGIVAKTDKKKGGKLMLASGILGIALFFWMWMLPGLLLTIGGIIAIRTSE
ncbi:DUF4064 domain-containing protein [Methanococcoides burtonii]|uniref:Uncharacterized protein n=1 Tax=Methanococcoides burtonii (strain DSM 6242 / NBRC 107633 / OCM 468 / ACE-M) TaxID=259564 RepID=Q12UE5_METBU|nr:DUF4064 domain-containing protein [Methanococcoides burtonii]ABE52931.1 Hypothetical protein Mbur_2055 [Methanococcoides burtonii DSM 6242]